MRLLPWHSPLLAGALAAPLSRSRRGYELAEADFEAVARPMRKGKKGAYNVPRDQIKAAVK